MTMSQNPPVERVKPVSLISIMSLLLMVGLFSLFAYFTFFPKAVFFNVQPAGASVYSNGKLLCPATPCKSSLNRIFPKRITIDRAQHFPYIINLEAFGIGWDDTLENVIRLQYMLDDSEIERGMKTCQAQRVKMPDPDNIDAEPCYRVPPVMPWRAKRSGHCHLVFDIHDTGKTKNIRINGCTERVFENAAIQAVQLWTYLPKIENGEAVERLGVKNKITFRLTDELGRIISEPLYFEENSEHEHNVSVHPSFEK